ncbi:MAG: helix-turn-helix domain-containing protein [Myxococcota bacterium]
MTAEYSELAKQLRAAIEESKHTIDQLADRTKVPRTTILALVEEPIAAVLPERVYLRGHLKVLARALQLDPAQMAEMFDTAYPLDASTDNLASSVGPGRNLAVSAGLYGIAIIAVVVAFATAMS